MVPFSDETKSFASTDVEEHLEDLKIPLGVETKRKAMDWSSYLTEESAARRPSALKAAFQHLAIPGIISLGGGLPLPAYFPIHEVSVKVPVVGKFSETETALQGAVIKLVKYLDHQIPHPPATAVETYINGVINGAEEFNDFQPKVGLSTTLQYGLGTGEANLISFFKRHTQIVHNPPYEDWETTLTCGNTYAFYSCMRMLVERGDYIIMEEFAYSSAISTCAPLGIKIVGVEMDEQGMTAIALDHVLSTWDVTSRGARKPQVIYLVPYLPIHSDWLTQNRTKPNRSIHASPTPYAHLRSLPET